MILALAQLALTACGSGGNDGDTTDGAAG